MCESETFWFDRKLIWETASQRHLKVMIAYENDKFVKFSDEEKSIQFDQDLEKACLAFHLGEFARMHLIFDGMHQRYGFEELK